MSQQPMPILQGDLSRIELPDVLSFIAMIRRTGRLTVRSGNLERNLVWKDGDIVFATSNSLEHSLGQFLLRNGKITLQQYEETKRRVTAQTRHGKLLVQTGAISPKDLWWGVKHQTLDILYSLFGWQNGDFAFSELSEDEVAHERIALSLNTSSVIMEGIRRLDETARIKEKVPSLDVVFMKVPGTVPDFQELDMNEHEIEVYDQIDGKRSVTGLIGRSDMTEFEVSRILFQLVSARLIEEAPEEKGFRPVFLDVEDSPQLLNIISTYNDMFGRLYGALQEAVGDDEAREVFMNALQQADGDELWAGVFFDQYGRFDENMLIANISELPFEKRKAVLEEGLNTLLSVQLFEVSQHLDAAGKVEVFRFISEQKASLERVGA